MEPNGVQVEPTGAHMYTLYMERDPPKWLEFSWEGFEFSWKGCVNIHGNRLEFHANLKKNGGCIKSLVFNENTRFPEENGYLQEFPLSRWEPCLNAGFNVGPADPQAGFMGSCGIRHPTWDAVRQLGFRTGEERSAWRVSYVRSEIWCGPRN